ncbi:MAG: ribonuclease E/G, partial [Pseudomonadales bacterium]
MGIQDGCVVITDIRISRMKGRCWGAAFAGSKLLELFTESDQETHQVGDILIGKVDRVLSGLAYAFVDLGQGQAGFLPTHETRYPELFGHEDSLSVRAGSGATAIQVGSPVLAQVVRAQEGDKGPRLSRRISLASSLIVYVPSGQGLSVSQKIKDEATRRRLEAMGRLLLKGQVGALVFRTLAGRATELELVQAFKVLLDRWRSLAARSKRSQAIRCIEETASAPLRWVTAWLNPDVMSVTVDADVDFQIIHDYLASA